MVKTCVAPFCGANASWNNVPNSHLQKLSFHRLPISQPKLYAQWVGKLTSYGNSQYRAKYSERLHTLDRVKHYRVCSLHFATNEYQPSAKTPQLKPYAVPTLFGADIGSRATMERFPNHSILHDHSNYILSSPRALKRKLEMSEEREKVIKKKTDEIYRVKKRYMLVKEALQDIAKKKLMDDDTLTHLSNTFSGVLLELVSNEVINQEKYPTMRRYSEGVKNFSMTLFFYSPKAYRYMRTIFTLPCPSTIRSWYTVIGGEPGFTAESFEALKKHTKEKSVHCCVMLDGMAIQQFVEFDKHKEKHVGYVDLGGQLGNEYDQSTEVAKEALVVMAVCLHEHWKIPLGYFLTKGLSGEAQAGLIQETIIRLRNVGITTEVVVGDGLSANLKMAQELGACTIPDTLQSTFPDPTDETHKITFLLDACHMIKLARNSLASEGTFQANGQLIKWDFITKLHKLQDGDGLHAANKLRQKHIDFQKQKMKVNLAVQTLSASVGKALEFLDKSGMPEFQGSEATVDFLLRMDRLFDILNSKGPFGKGYKAPLRLQSEYLWRQFLIDTRKYLLELRDSKGVRLCYGRKGTFVIGFLMGIDTLLHLTGVFMREPECPVKYLSTYKLSQDYLEVYFSCIRLRNGCNNNPTSRQFKYAYRALLFHNSLKPGAAGNVTQQDATVMLSVDSSIGSAGEVQVSQSLLDMLPHCDVVDHDYIANCSLSEYSENVVCYIGGNVVRTALGKLNCSTCRAALLGSGPEECGTLRMRLITTKDNGGLIYPALSVFRILRITELLIRMKHDQVKKPESGSRLIQKLSTEVMTHIQSHNIQLFTKYTDHFTDTNTLMDSHYLQLIKLIIKLYANIRYHHQASTHTSKTKGQIIRQHNNKISQFRGQ